jgi:predicted RNA methylase
MTENLDKFFTNTEVAERCCKLIHSIVDIDFNNDFVIEPSAGNGSFVKPVKTLCRNHVFIDIDPEHSQVQKFDFLKTKPFFWKKLKKSNQIHVIGNPPFGSRGSNAIKFIKHSCDFCDSFSFILPLSFAKTSMKKTVPEFFHLSASYDIPVDSFYYKEETYNIPCVFQIWERKKYPRKKEKKIIPNGYHFVKNPEQADLSIRRVGSHAGKILDTIGRNTNSHYFIKLNNNKDIAKLKDIRLKSTDFVTGPRSISKQDIIKNVNKMIASG